MEKKTANSVKKYKEKVMSSEVFQDIPQSASDMEQQIAELSTKEKAKLSTVSGPIGGDRDLINRPPLFARYRHMRSEIIKNGLSRLWGNWSSTSRAACDVDDITGYLISKSIHLYKEPTCPNGEPLNDDIFRAEFGVEAFCYIYPAVLSGKCQTFGQNAFLLNRHPSRTIITRVLVDIAPRPPGYPVERTVTVSPGSESALGCTYDIQGDGPAEITYLPRSAHFA